MGIWPSAQPVEHRDIPCRGNDPLPGHRRNLSGHLWSQRAMRDKVWGRLSECSSLPKECSRLKCLRPRVQSSISGPDSRAAFRAKEKRVASFLVLWKAVSFSYPCPSHSENNPRAGRLRRFQKNKSNARRSAASNPVMISSGDAMKPRLCARLLAVPRGRTPNGIPLSISSQPTFPTVPSPPGPAPDQQVFSALFCNRSSSSIGKWRDAPRWPMQPSTGFCHAFRDRPSDCASI